ncbi:MAG: RimK/LysX family protein [Desulfobacterales bacterium]|nr:RimK/LysX family protein [Desulfobacterales bacterium]
MMGNRQKRFRIHPILQSVGLVFLLVLTIPVLFPSGKVNAGERITIGEVEDVILIPWRVKLPARIDTGAATSSLDARELKVKNNIAEFKLPKKYGGLLLRLPVVEWQNIRSADFKERRPVVEITLCMGPKLIRTQVTLNDRSLVRYPLIIGRNILKDNFIVDCMHSNCLPPSCPEVPSQ